MHVDRVETGRSLAFTWWESSADASRVELEIVTGADGGSRLEITETFPPAAAGPEAHASAERWEVRVCALWACTVVAALVQ